VHVDDDDQGSTLHCRGFPKNKLVDPVNEDKEIATDIYCSLYRSSELEILEIKKFSRFS
jgi:hypothetical protein